MNDRELLQLAAKADGNPKLYFNSAIWCLGDEYDRDGYPRTWNPLTDDGDALRLAVKLELQLRLKHSENAVRVYGAPEVIDEGVFGDPNAATRRAIVRAAAEIGAKMPACPSSSPHSR